LKIDLHVHTSERSACGKAAEDEVIHTALEQGLDGLAFTDHGRLPPPGHLERLRERCGPLRLFTGIEIRVADEDFLVLGLHHPLLERTDWRYDDLHAFARDSGGFLVLAHPYRFADSLTVDIEARPPDAVEVRSVHIPPSAADRIHALADRLGMRLLANSDAHFASSVGTFYNVLDAAPDTDADLVAALRNRPVSCASNAARVQALGLAI